MYLFFFLFVAISCFKNVAATQKKSHKRSQFAYENHAKSNKIRVLVNNEPITEYDIDQRIRLNALLLGMELTNETYQMLAKQTLKTLVDEALQKSLARLLKSSIPEREAQQAFDNVAKSNNMTRLKFEKHLNLLGIAPKTLLAQLAAQLFWHSYLDSLVSETQKSKQKLKAWKTPESPKNTSKMNLVSKKDIQKYEAKLKTEHDQTRYELLEITLRDLPKMQKNLLEKLKNPEFFQKYAKRFSQSSSALKGGYRGWVSLNQLEPEIAEYLQKKELFDSTSFIKTSQGYQMFFIKNIQYPNKKTELQSLIAFVVGIVPDYSNSSNLEEQIFLKKIKQEIDQLKTYDDFLKKLKKHGLPFREFKDIPFINFISNFSDKKTLENIKKNGKVTQAETQNGQKIWKTIFFREKKTEPFKPPSSHEIKNYLQNRKLDLISKQYLNRHYSTARIEYRN
jgi:peptidyl-prolyl cis-trans isomerase SurA